MRPTAHKVQLFFGLLTASALFARRQIDLLYSKTFPTRRRLLLALLGVLLSLLLGLSASEIGLRLLDLPFRPSRARAETPLAQFDSELGWAYVPNRYVTQEFGLPSRKVSMHFDEIGSRVGAPGESHDPTAPTVLLVGDSYTFGHGVPYEETFAGRLASRPDFPFQVVNLGVQAYGTDQSLLMLRRHFHRFNTKAVVYTFIDVHILRNSVYDRRLINPRAAFLGTKPQFALQRDGTLHLSRRPIRYEDFHPPRVWSLFQVVMTRWGPKPSLALTRALVQQMKDYVESNGAMFFMVLWDQGNYFDPPPTLRPGQSPFRGMNLNLIDTTAHAPPGWRRWIIPGDGHADARAHAHVADLLFEELESRLQR